jgi:drug/metabolite transporter (DMT)-like permease
MLLSFPIFFVIALGLWISQPASRPSFSGRLWFKIAGLGFLGYYLSSYLDLKGLEMISAGLERLSLYIMPIFVTILGIAFFGEKSTLSLWKSLGLTLSGIAIFYSAELSFSGEDSLEGVMWVVGAALSFAFYMLFSKKVIHQIGSLWFTALAMMASSVFVIFQSVMGVNLAPSQLTNMAWLWVGALVIFSTVIPSFMTAEAIKRIGSAKSSIMGTLGPIVTIGFAIIFLGEPFGWTQAFGALLVIWGVNQLRK